VLTEWNYDNENQNINLSEIRSDSFIEQDLVIYANVNQIFVTIPNIATNIVVVLNRRILFGSRNKLHDRSNIKVLYLARIAKYAHKTRQIAITSITLL